MHRIRHLWHSLRASFWFLPSVMVAASIPLAALLIGVEHDGRPDWLERLPHMFGASAEGSRGMLTAIASSMMSIVGITFSMTLVALSLASSQFSSRVVRNFMRSRMTQSALGVFAGIFTYCLIVLRSIRSGEDALFVPSMAVFFGLAMAVVGVGVLIYFLHHIASSIQVSNIVAIVAQDTCNAIDRIFPAQAAAQAFDAAEEEGGAECGLEWHVVPSAVSGYLQRIDDAALLELAAAAGTVMRIERGIGEFVVEGGALVSFATAGAPTARNAAAVRAAFVIGRYRTLEQDVAFGVRQLVDVALRALSPGVNDTTTAINCIDYLSVVLSRLAPRPMSPRVRRAEGGACVIGRDHDFAAFLSESFDQIRRNARGDFTVLSRLVDALETVAALTVDPLRRERIAAQLLLVDELGVSVSGRRDRAELRQRVRAVANGLLAE